MYENARQYYRYYELRTSIGVNNIIDVNPIHSNTQNHIPLANNKQLQPIIPIKRSILPNLVGGT